MSCIAGGKVGCCVCSSYLLSVSHVEFLSESGWGWKRQIGDEMLISVVYVEEGWGVCLWGGEQAAKGGGINGWDGLVWPIRDGQAMSCIGE